MRESNSTTGGGAAADRLRDRIDHGATRDKVDARDPAASPLGTDDEAGGAAGQGGRSGAAAPDESVNVARSNDVRSRSRMTPSRLLAGTALLALLAIVIAVSQFAG